jgi:hypothetical protein
METFRIFLEDPWMLQVDSVTKMNETNCVDSTDFSNLHSLNFSVGNVPMLPNLFKKKKVESFHEVES